MSYGIICHLRKIIEDWHPFLFAGFVTCFFLFYTPVWINSSFCNNFSTILINILSIFLGFAFASISLLISLGENKFLKNARQTGAFQNLMNYHFKSLLWCFIGISFAVAYTLIDPCTKLTLWGATLIGIGTGCVFCFLRLCRLLWLVLKYAGYL